MTTAFSDEVIDPQLKDQMDDSGLFDEDIKPGKQEELDDLFGGDDAEDEKMTSPSASASMPRDGSEALSAAEVKRRKKMEYEEDEGPDDAALEIKRAVLEIPNIPTPRSSDGNYWVIKMPSFVKLDSKPFLRETYIGPDQAEGGQGLNAREKSMTIKLDVENTIRWKWAKDELNNDIRQSNSRIIKWSDGSLSLLLGKELFDVNQAYENTSALARQQSNSAVLNSSSQSQTSSSAHQTRTSGLTYIVAQHKRPGILQAEAPIAGYMTLRPTGMQSETHRMLARAVGQKHSKVARLRMAPDPTTDPAQQQMPSKPASRRQNRTRASMGAGGPSSARKRSNRSYGRRRSDSMWSDEEPESGIFGDSEDDDSESYNTGNPRRNQASRKKRRGSGGDSDYERGGDKKRGAGEYQTDDFLVADSSDEEGEDEVEGTRKQKKRGKPKTEGDAGDADALDEIEARIAKQEENRRKKKQAETTATEGSGPGKGGVTSHSSEEKKREDESMDVDMDVESEEEEEFNVRRAGTGARRKRAIAMDEEEEE